MDTRRGLVESSPTDETIDAPPGSLPVVSAVAPTGGSSSSDGARPVAFVEGSGVRLSTETQDLLRCRLRSASLVMATGFGLFFIFLLFQMKWDDPRYLVMFASHATVASLLAVFGLSLCRNCTISTEQLRWQELVVFGGPALYFLLLDWVRQTTRLPDQYLQSAASGWIVLMVTYALFIPNTWQRAAFFIAAFAVMPVVATAVLLFPVPAYWTAHNGGWPYIIELVLVLGIAGTTSVLGVAMIGGLRKEAFAAKQLNQYKLKRLLGVGGMGEVHLAEHSLLKRPCAIKIIRPEKAGDPKVLARFEREVRAAARLTHWNSIEIFDYGRTEDGTFFYVMEYLPGLSLQELVQKHGPLPAERVVHLLTQTCEALAEAHRLGLIHRDIKPANIFAAQRGGVYDVAKLLDFGLVKPMVELGESGLTQDGSIAGSPLYMSPEQATGDTPPDARSDIYAVGALAYFLLTGRPPFLEEKAIKVLMAHAYEKPHPPSRHEASIPHDLEQMVLKCLEKKPEHRYQSAEELAADLSTATTSGRWTSLEARAWWQRNETNGTAEPQVAESVGHEEPEPVEA